MFRDVRAEVKKRLPEAAGLLKELIAMPTVSSRRESGPAMRGAAERIMEEFRSAGLERVRLLKTEGWPAVYGEWLRAPGVPTVLLYAHYDVEEAGDPAGWSSPPFSPEMREGRIYGRGAADNKGQFVCQLMSLNLLMNRLGKLPVNVKLLAEGEEEIGSPGLPGLLKAHAELLSADLAVVCDTAMPGPGLPAVCIGTRGLLGFELRVKGADRDLHSGSLYGGAVPNPCHALAELLASMRDAKGRIAVPGFYDGVRPVSDEERRWLASVPLDGEKMLRDLGLSRFSGEEGYGWLERVWLRPTLEVNALSAGPGVDGIPGVIPREAAAKVSCRLVEGQEPEKIRERIELFVRKRKPAGVEVELSFGPGARAWSVPHDHPLVRLAAECYEEAYGAPAVRIRAGGTIPVLEMLDRTVSGPVLLMGFSLPEFNAHGPDEHFSLRQLEKGIETLCRFWMKLGDAAGESGT